MSSGNPEDLLRSALEKIVFFECRVSQLEGELESERALAGREKETSAALREREVEIETLLSRERAEAASSRSRASELGERVRLLEAEREKLLAGMVEQARLSADPQEAAEAEGPDLAGFIAELRAEIERLGRWKAAAERAGISVEEDPGRARGNLREGADAPARVPEAAARFEKEGRLGVAPAAAARLQGPLAAGAERSLHASSVDDLSSPDADRRRRAAECLAALGSKAAAPPLVAAMGREREPEVKVALLSALAALREPAAAEIALREWRDPSPAVRGAALEAVAALRPDRAGAVLAQALADASALVRRRAVLLLGFVPGKEAEEALASALADGDAGVARAAALALAGRPSARAQGALARALDHREPAVRRAAAQAVSRWAGEPLDDAAPPGERRRAARRIVEKLGALDEGALRSAVVAAAPRDRFAVPPAPAATPAARAVAQARTAVAVVDPPPSQGGLEPSIVAEVRAALRGCSSDELARLVSAEPAAVEAALAALVARGTLARRGARFFMS